MINRQYEDGLQHVLDNGTVKTDRTGTGTLSVFGMQLRYNLEAEGFPVITSKTVHWKSVAEELAWMLRGETNVKSLQERGVKIWDKWADENGELGPVYGKQWRSWAFHDDTGSVEYIDQISNVIESIKTKPDSRRHIVTAWNPAEVDSMKLPPCHAFFQFNVRDGRLDLQLYQRSADLFIGVPFNIASYSLLLVLIARETGLVPGEFIWTGGDCHIYSDHMDQVKEQLSREPRPFPGLWVSDDCNLFDMSVKDVALVDYTPHPTIKAPVAV